MAKRHRGGFPGSKRKREEEEEEEDGMGTKIQPWGGGCGGSRARSGTVPAGASRVCPPPVNL